MLFCRDAEQLTKTLEPDGTEAACNAALSGFDPAGVSADSTAGSDHINFGSYGLPIGGVLACENAVIQSDLVEIIARVDPRIA